MSLPTCGGGDRVLGLKGEDQEPMLECLEAALLNIEEEKSQPRLDSYFKGTVSLILNDSQCKDGNARFIMVP